MLKKSISIVQPNFQQGPSWINAYYLPYSAGAVLAYAFSDPSIAQDWKINQIVWRRDSVEELAQILSKDQIVGFSTYVWNKNYNYTLGKRIKELNPDCLLVVGGPEPAISNPDIFKLHPWIDLIVVTEGEITFKRILENYGQDYAQIPGLVINQNGQAVLTESAERIQNLECVPSPYLMGIFDQIVQDNPDVIWNATIETNRGCPYACTFCDWGSLTYNKVKQFDLTRVFAEIDWAAKYCEQITLADANFGMFVERDSAIADHILEAQGRDQKLKYLLTCWAKNQKNEVVQIVKKLITESRYPLYGLTISVQSMDDDVLDIIKRKNLKQHKLTEIFELCDQNNIPAYTELILGLPGESLDSWKESVFKVFRAGNHYGLAFYQSQLLENAEMNLLQRKLYKIETAEVYDYFGGSRTHSKDTIAESISVTTGTSTLPREQMLEAMQWTSFIQTFHVGGLTTYLARFLHKQGIDYSEFYNKLYEYLQQIPWFKHELAETKKYFDMWFTTGRTQHPKIGTLDIPGALLFYRMALLLYYQDRIGWTYECIKDFMQQNFTVDNLDELLSFQQHVIYDYQGLKMLPLSKSFSQDFLGYIQSGSDLDQPAEYVFETKETPKSLEAFIESIWFGKRRSFGRANIVKITGNVA